MPPRGSPTRISSSPARSRRSSTGDPARAARSKARPTTTSASPTSSTTSRPDPVAAGSEPVAGVRAPRITCPFCGLVCDDLTVAPTGVDPRGCARAAAGFARAGAPRRPHTVAGQAVGIAPPAAAAAAILRAARAPLFDGLAADLHGIRALLALADATGGAVDYVNSPALLANATVARASGWVAATFGEV